MAAGANDKFTKSYSFLQKSLGATITDSATSLTLNNYTNIPTDTKVHFIIDRIDSNGNRTNSTRELVSGICNGSSVTSVSRGLHGTTAQSHDSGAVVEFVLSGAAWNDLIDGILVEHNQDGTHSDITANSIVVADAGTLDVDTINEATAANGVTVDGMSIKDGVVVGASGKGVLNSSLGTGAGELGAAWQSWSPSYSGITVGNGTLDYAKYIQIGKTVHFRFKFTFGSTSAMGTGVFSAPVTANSDYSTTDNIGLAKYVDSSTSSNNSSGMCRLESTTTIRPIAFTVSTYLRDSTVSSSIPFTWATGDYIYVEGTYEAA